MLSPKQIGYEIKAIVEENCNEKEKRLQWYIFWAFLLSPITLAILPTCLGFILVIFLTLAIAILGVGVFGLLVLPIMILVEAYSEWRDQRKTRAYVLVILAFLAAPNSLYIGHTFFRTPYLQRIKSSINEGVRAAFEPRHGDDDEGYRDY